MKKFTGSILAVLFLTAVAAPVFAVETSKEATPTAKTMKHKAAKHAKKSSHKKGTIKPESTPVPKK